MEKWVIDPKTVFYFIGAAVTALLAATVVAARFWYKWRHGTQQAQHETSEGWQSLAGLRKEEIQNYKEEFERLQKRCQKLTEQNEECEDKLKKFGLELLQQIAMTRRVQRTVNKLEIKLGVELTDFDGPDGENSH